MSTTTATILVGYSHPHHSGINPTHMIRLLENSRPLLILCDLDGKEGQKMVIPTVENMLDDIYLMIAVYVLKKVHPLQPIHNLSGTSLYEILTTEERERHYAETRNALEKTTIKVVVNIFSGSSLLSMVDKIKSYPNDFEVTLPALKKEFNVWSGKVEEDGL